MMDAFVLCELSYSCYSLAFAFYSSEYLTEPAPIYKLNTCFVLSIVEQVSQPQVSSTPVSIGILMYDTLIQCNVKCVE